MYEQVSHSLLNNILIALRPQLRNQHLQHFYTRLGANFYAIHSLFCALYGERPDFEQQLQALVETLARQYIKRPSHLKKTDLERERNHNWFLSQKWVGMALYCDGFAGTLGDLQSRLGYLQDLGINLLHVMPICDCPEGNNDGGYAVRDYRKIGQRFGTLEDLEALASNLRKREMLLTLDVVVNHTSDEHEWARRARAGEETYQDYYYVFPDRQLPDIYEETMPEIFPETAPGNFTWDAQMGKWVMTVFNNYQWDLNYHNPAVLIEMLDVLLFWANKGADILRLDAVAFLWKKIGSQSQNEREAHQLLQLMKDCCQVSAPGVLFIAEAIVAPGEIVKYFGEDAINAKECEIAYNATFMALLWEAVATKQTTLLNMGINSIPHKLERTTWLNYLRCHDDIGWGFADADIIACGYDPQAHRRFLVDYYTGRHDYSNARGVAFGHNDKTGDARISGALASLAGLQTALETHNPDAIDSAIQVILLLHSMILSFGGIPLLYYGDGIGTLNDDSYLNDPLKSSDSRWMHRPRLNWDKAELRHHPGTLEHRLFSELKKMIAIRKETTAFADQNNRDILTVDNPHLFVFSRFDVPSAHTRVLVVGNFSNTPQPLPLASLRRQGYFQFPTVLGLVSGNHLDCSGDELIIPAHGFHWLKS